MATTDHDTAATAAVREAQCLIINAKWHLRQEQALARLAAHHGLACAPLFPEHPVIQVVAFNGRPLGRARLHHTDTTERWIATIAPTAHQIGAYRSLRAAARALARAAGLPGTRVTCLRAQNAAGHSPG
ncbi:hypothetical protein [Streptomyces noursei]|uniref:hypothetical protein n=1 Tax=Streptomyces noursei TaxID=1971 RepID=UPI0005C811CF|nr:hypothetical protein [Streptomyces noursei]